MLNIILRVFDEMKLITLEKATDECVTVTLLKTEGKVNIENSQFLQQLRK